MKIAQVAPLYESVPPRLYGGTERIVAHLSDALIEFGHDVTLFASADARTSARLVPVRNQAIRLDPHPFKSDLAAHLCMLQEVHLGRHEFDVIHFHVDLIHFPFFEELAHKTVTTLHGRLDLEDLPGAYARWPQYPLVSISNDQRRPLPGANWVRTIQHGVPDDLLCSMAEPKGDYLAFLGRISPEKRPNRAIAIARRAGLNLKIAAKVDAACGTLVIAWRCGAVPEVVDDGVTGFIVTSEDEAVSAVERASTLDRAEIRRTFERRFTSWSWRATILRSTGASPTGAIRTLRWRRSHHARAGAGAGAPRADGGNERRSFQNMDEDRIEGVAKQVKGAVKEGVGKAVGDVKLQAEGEADRAEGKVQNALGGLKDALRKA